MRLLAASLAPSWDTQSPRLREGGSLEGESRADLVIVCLTGLFKCLTSFVCGCLYCSLICRWVNCSLPHLALLLWARRELAGVLLFVCSREEVCIHLPWRGCRLSSQRASFGARFLQGLLGLLLAPEAVPWHRYHKAGVGLQPDLLLHG